MMHRAWISIVKVPYCFSRSSIKFQGHTALKIVEFDPNWAFPDCNSSLNSPMAMKCCTKLETAKERCPIIFQGHPSNFKVTRYKTSPILTQIGRFRTIGQSQLSNPSDLPCWSPQHVRIRAWKNIHILHNYLSMHWIATEYLWHVFAHIHSLLASTIKMICIGNHQQLDCLFISLIRLTPKKVHKSKSCIYGTTLADEHLLLTEKILLLFLLWFILSYMFHRPENLLRDGGTHIHLLWGGGSGHSYSLIVDWGGALTSNVHVFTI